MRKILITALAGLTIGGSVLAWNAQAQPAPPPPDDAEMHMHPGMHMGFPMMPPHGMPDIWHHQDMLRLGALVATAPDRKLSGADVQKIAEAFLLFHGNHSWKVTSVTENSDNTVSFNYATPNGDPIATFKVDRKTGHVERVS